MKAVPQPSVALHPAVEEGKIPDPEEVGLTEVMLGIDLSEKAKEVWQELWGTKPVAFRSSDHIAVGRYCVMVGVWRTLWKELVDSGFSHVREDRYRGTLRSVAPEFKAVMELESSLERMEKVLGLTPDSRLRLPEESLGQGVTDDDRARAAFFG